MRNKINQLKKVHFFIGSESDFYNMNLNISANKNSAARYLRGKKCIYLPSLFNEFSAALQFPYYFGENWDAFDECLNDLSWINGSELALFLSEFNLVLQGDEKNKDRFLTILQLAILEWQEKGMNLHIFLHMDCEDVAILENIRTFFGEVEIIK